MRNIYTYIKFISLGLLICTVSCKKEIQNIKTEKKLTTEISSKKDALKKIISTNSEPSYHIKTSNSKFNHKISGKDENGNQVNGVINLEDEIGIGVLKKDDTNEIEIVSEHISSNRIIATDINGYHYKLKFDDE